ncbi:MAG: T9SS type A sorting domain-containing protein [Candidatus Latescibacterota bacterium]
MITRRKFIQSVSLAGAAAFTPTVRALASRRQASTGYFGLHPFIESHPEAVFIMKTAVDKKTNTEAILQAGLSFGRSVFVPRSEGGIPLNITIPVKPNIKTGSPSKHPMDEIFTHTTDPFFMEGMFGGLKELGIAGSQFRMREVTWNNNFAPYGYVDMAKRVGADLRTDLEPALHLLQEGRDYNWVDVPNGVHYKRIPYLEPINTPNTWQMNISKMKAHGMGLTLCCKNIQGSIAHDYQQFCADWGAKMSIDQNDRVTGAYDAIKKNFERHLAGGVPRWDKPSGNSFNGGLGHETWVTRTLDNIAASNYGIHIIEAIVSRDGQGNEDYGPNPQDQNHTFGATGVSTTGKAWDYMQNMIIFGKDVFRTDIIGKWLGGHEAGNFGLFHCALDRGMSTALDPRRIPVYIWENGTATLTKLEDLPVTPLLTYYLARNYNGQTEKIYHLCNEPVDYVKFQGAISGVSDRDAAPRSFVLHQNHPNPFNPYTSIEYVVPKGGQVRLEVYNASGQLMDVLVDGYRSPGAHMAAWNAHSRASGTYFYRFRCGSFTETRKMMLLK